MGKYRKGLSILALSILPLFPPSSFSQDAMQKKSMAHTSFKNLIGETGELGLEIEGPKIVDIGKEYMYSVRLIMGKPGKSGQPSFDSTADSLGISCIIAGIHDRDADIRADGTVARKKTNSVWSEPKSVDDFIRNLGEENLKKRSDLIRDLLNGVLVGGQKAIDMGPMEAFRKTFPPWATDQNVENTGIFISRPGNIGHTAVEYSIPITAKADTQLKVKALARAFTTQQAFPLETEFQIDTIAGGQDTPFGAVEYFYRCFGSSINPEAGMTVSLAEWYADLFRSVQEQNLIGFTVTDMYQIKRSEDIWYIFRVLEKVENIEEPVYIWVKNENGWKVSRIDLAAGAEKGFPEEVSYFHWKIEEEKPMKKDFAGKGRDLSLGFSAKRPKLKELAVVDDEGFIHPDKIDIENGKLKYSPDDPMQVLLGYMEAVKNRDSKSAFNLTGTGGPFPNNDSRNHMPNLTARIFYSSSMADWFREKIPDSFKLSGVRKTAAFPEDNADRIDLFYLECKYGKENKKMEALMLYRGERYRVMLFGENLNRERR